MNKSLVSLLAVLLSALLLFGLGMALAPISFPNLEPAWRAYLLMASVFVVILFLSYLPVLVYSSFSLRVRQRAKSRTLDEIKRYHLQELACTFHRNFDKAYEESNYVMPLLLATISLLAGWVLFFFHQGPAVLESVGVDGVINSFLNTMGNAHIALFGFLGAYFYTLGVLYHRYITADLTPSVFLHIGTRIWVAIVLSLMLSVVFPGHGWLPAAAFTAGVFPNSGLSLITSTLRGLASFGGTYSNNLRLVRGIGIWHQSRLQEEDVDEVQNLATADLEGLVITTRLGVLRLVHWIDQAILILHIGEEHVKAFHETGIITATDFREAYFAGRPRCGKAEERAPFAPPPEELVNALQSRRDEGRKGEPVTAERVKNMMIAIISDYNFVRVDRFHTECHRSASGT